MVQQLRKFTNSEIRIRRQEQISLATIVPRVVLTPQETQIKQRRLTGPSRFDVLGEFMYGNFKLQAESYGMPRDHASRAGFLLLGRLAARAPSAYRLFCEREDRAASLTELSAILQSSCNVIDFLSYMHGDQNRLYEYSFGLRGPVTRGAHPLVVHATDKGVLYDFEPATLAEASEEAKREGLAAVKGQSYRFCPARGRALHTLWEATVAHCVEIPELFAHDLGLVPTSVQ